MWTGKFLNPERKSCRFKNILMPVDGVWVTLRTLRMYDGDGDDEDHKDIFSVLVGIKTCLCWICYACVQFQIETRQISGSFVLLLKTLEIGHLMLLIGRWQQRNEPRIRMHVCTAIVVLIKPFGDVLVAVAVVVCGRSLLCLRWFYKATFTRQTKFLNSCWQT